jgi:UTP--glucose-1-phosphate uridylyltransferase
MKDVEDAIILAGGMGTRMLPASLYMPKETMPLVDTPILNHLIWEAAKAGVTRIHLVLSERKNRILGEHLENGTIYSAGVRNDLPRESLSLGLSDVELIPHVQHNPGGVADAISIAAEYIKGPFLVLLGDMLILEEHLGPEFSGKENASIASLNLVSMYRKHGLPCVGVYKVEKEKLEKYGVVDLSEGNVCNIVEKPTESEAPSQYILCGRYLLPENTTEILTEYPISEFGELQSIMLLNHLINNGGLKAVIMDQMTMYDGGDPLSWLKAQIDHALNRESMGEELMHWIRKRI